MDFAVPVKQRLKLKESEKKNKYLDLAKELKRLWNMSDVYTNYNWCSWYSHQRINKGTGGLVNKRTSGDYTNYYIIEIGQNTENSPGDLRRLVVIQTPVKDRQLTRMWKILKEQIIIIADHRIELKKKWKEG